MRTPKNAHHNDGHKLIVLSSNDYIRKPYSFVRYPLSSSSLTI